MEYVCADCGHEQNTHIRCNGCGNGRVIAASVALGLLGPNWRKAFDPGGMKQEDLPPNLQLKPGGRIVEIFQPTEQQFNHLVEWAEQCRILARAKGRPLNEEELACAARAGVRDANDVILHEVIQMPGLPESLAEYAPLLNPAEAIGLTLGNAVLVLGKMTWRRHSLLEHELRHVAQVERCGGLREFLREYVKQVLEHGYENAPFEVEARNGVA